MVSPRNSIGLPGPREQRQAELIGQVAAGDEHALASLYDDTSRLVFGLLLRILNDAGAAEEVLLDVYTQVWRQAATYSTERGAPLAWLTTIARSRAIDRLRAVREKQQRTEPLEASLYKSAASEDVEEEWAAREMQKAVRAALDALPPEQRELIELAYFGGMSHGEIAEAKGQPLGTVKTRIRLGMSKLRDALKLSYGGRE
jgi:RNA polymerase sigma-70 factor (ECF subfamily)